MKNAQQLYKEQKSNSCSMIGFLGIVIQLGLGVLSFSVLIIKRLRENPKRPWKIWIFDTSKQLFSQVLAHFRNLIISILLTQNDKNSDQCLWYLTTNILDNTLGVFMCVFCLIFIENKLIASGKVEYLSGNYYLIQKSLIKTRTQNYQLQQQFNEDYFQNAQNSSKQQNGQVKLVKSQSNNAIPSNNQNIILKKQISSSNVNEKRSMATIQQAQKNQYTQKYIINYKAWLIQLLIWIGIVIVGKGILFGFQFILQQPLKNVTFQILGWIQNYPLLQLFVVIVIIPVVMNGFAFWIQDNFLMKKDQITIENTQAPLQNQAISENMNQGLKEQHQISQ